MDSRKAYLSDKLIYIAADETSHKGKNWLAIEIGELSQEMRRFPIHTEQIANKFASTIVEHLEAVVREMGISKHNILQLMTDGARNMALVGTILAERGFCNMLHMTCVVHKVHNIADVIKRT